MVIIQILNKKKAEELLHLAVLPSLFKFHSIVYCLGNHPHPSVIRMGADEFRRDGIWLSMPVVDDIAHMGNHLIVVGLVDPEQRHVWQLVFAGSTNHRLFLDGSLPVAASYDDVGRKAEAVGHQLVEGFAVLVFPVLLHILTNLQDDDILPLADTTEERIFVDAEIVFPCPDILASECRFLVVPSEHSLQLMHVIHFLFRCTHSPVTSPKGIRPGQVAFSWSMVGNAVSYAKYVECRRVEGYCAITHCPRFIQTDQHQIVRLSIGIHLSAYFVGRK